MEPGLSTPTQVCTSPHPYPHSIYTVATHMFPGCACDVPSALYSFSFALNPKWTKLMPSWSEIKAYQEDVVEEYNLHDKMRFRTEIVQCIWQEDTARWLLVVRDLVSGETFHHECQILISATGLLAQPRECDIPGAASFKGALFHSARWDHSVDLEGKRVVVVGNGCEYRPPDVYVLREN